MRRAVGAAGKTLGVILLVTIIALAGYVALSAPARPRSSATSAGSTSTTTSATSSSTSLQALTASTAVGFSEVYFWPMLIGVQQGIFASHGLDVKWVPYSGGGPMYQAVAAGSAPIGLTGVAANIQARGSNVSVRCLAVYIPNNTFQVYVTGNSSITDIRQLDGKSVGVSALGGLENFYFVLLAQKFGIQLNYVGTGGLTQTLALLKTGQISAFTLTSNSLLKLVASNTIKSIYHVADAEPSNWQDGFCVYATDQFIQQNPDLTRRFVAGVLDTVKFMATNSTVPVQVYMKQTNSSQALAQQAYSAYHWQTMGQIDPNALQSMETSLAAAGLMKGTLPPVSSLYDTSFLPSG